MYIFFKKIDDRGFTLFEVLLSLALVSIIVAFLSGGFQLGQRIWEKNEIVKESLSIIPVRNFLSNTISTAQPIFFYNKLKRSQRYPVFRGGQDKLRFVVNRSNQLTMGGLHVVELFKEKVSEFKQKKNALIFQQSLFRHDLQSTQNYTKEVRTLIFNIKDLKFRYYGTPKKGMPKKWYDSWENFSNLPDLVSINIKFPKGDSRQWHQMLVELKLS